MDLKGENVSLVDEFVVETGESTPKPVAVEDLLSIGDLSEYTDDVIAGYIPSNTKHSSCEDPFISDYYNEIGSEEWLSHSFMGIPPGMDFSDGVKVETDVVAVGDVEETKTTVPRRARTERRGGRARGRERERAARGPSYASPPIIVARESELGRRCMHCRIEHTALWRKGPLGPKTLCNACGVRFSKGTLFPQYRPVNSPTFDPSLHSNKHKVVLELRNHLQSPQLPSSSSSSSSSSNMI